MRSEETYEGLGGKVGPELGAHNTAVAFVTVSMDSSLLAWPRVLTVRAGDLAPDNPDLGAPYRPLGAVDVSYTLAGVELCRCCIIDALELEKRGSRVGVALSSLVGKVLSPGGAC